MEEHPLLLATLPPDRRQKRLALLVALLLLVSFIALIPFAKIQLPPIGPYILIVDTTIFVIDSITATFLLVQFSVLRLPSLLALAGGYIFTAFMIVPHALTFPSAFTPNGLLGAGLQTTGWLYVLWHMGLPSAVIAYVLLKPVDETMRVSQSGVRSAILVTVLVVFLLTCALTSLTTKGVQYLPTMMSDVVNVQFAWHFVPPVALSIIAIVLLSSQCRSVLDLWLLVALAAWLFDALMLNNLITRFSLAWYVSRVFGLLGASFIFSVLLSETTVLYARLARSNMLLERERDNKLMNMEAMSAAIAHELKQPLTGIIGLGSATLRFLGQTPPNLARAESGVKKIIVAGQEITKILDNMRALFGRAKIAKDQIDVNELVVDALRALDSDFKSHRIAVSVNLTSELPPIMAHKVQLQEVIINLVHNAIEAMDLVDDDHRMLKFGTQLSAADTITVTIEDTGPGFDPEKSDAIFEVFVTTKPQGMGLGLAICQRIVEQHGGQLSASPGKPRGAIFRITLPRRD